MLALVVFHVLLANLVYALVQQTDVPAILYSYKLYDNSQCKSHL